MRINTSAWLRLAGLTVHADALANLPEIVGIAQVPSILDPIEAAQLAAAAAGTAAGTAACAAARDAAWAAAIEKLAATKRELQRTAVALVERMIAAEEPQKRAT